MYLTGLVFEKCYNAFDETRGKGLERAYLVKNCMTNQCQLRAHIAHLVAIQPMSVMISWKMPMLAKIGLTEETPSERRK